MHNVYNSYVMTLSLTAIIVLSVTLLFPLDSAFGQILSTNTDGTRILWAQDPDHDPNSQYGNHAPQFTDSATLPLVKSSFTFTNILLNITAFGNDGPSGIYLVVSPPISSNAAEFRMIYNRVGNLVIFTFSGIELTPTSDVIARNYVLGPPLIFSSAYTDTTGRNITVVFSDNITVGSTTFLSDFAIINSSTSVNSITSNNATSIILSLNSALSFDDSPLLSYNDTGTNITSVSTGLSLANFTNQPITNNVPSPPNFVNAYTNQRGDNITVNFDKVITLTNTTSPTDFAVNISGIATTSITRHNDTAINLTLDSNIPLALPLTLSYSQTTSNITNVNDLSLANFTNQPITNNVPTPPNFVNAYTNQRGDNIIVNFDKVVTLTNTTSPTDFAVNISGIATSITRHNDTAINLTLDSNIPPVLPLTLSYNQTTSNITNVNDLSLANFTNQPITNNVQFFDLPSLWDTRQKITINSNQITTTLQNFTLLVSISDSALNNSAVLPNGADIIFTSSDGFTILQHEIESFTNNATTGTLVAWVRLPTLSNTSDTILYMYYNVSIAATIIHDNVWDSDYEIIYHMDQSTFGAQSTLDSSGNDCHATPRTAGSGIFLPDNLVSAQIGNGLNFDGVDNNGNYLDLPDLEGSLFHNTDFTISAWANIDVLKNWARIVDFGNGQDNNNILIATPPSSMNLIYDVRRGTEL
ncbi:MAG: DUF2341 domain-containing protein [Candidatus Nitrosoabyssus spongiisocia]|nr:MAG: DUF2341 domain-containing protein [Nitrosopumilaceae archaeon AB1(1)]